MERLLEIKTVKAALIKAGYTGVRVRHGAGTAWGWLDIKCDELPSQGWRNKYNEVLIIVQQVTGRHGDYGISIS